MPWQFAEKLGSAASVAKALTEKTALSQRLKRCATQKRVFQQTAREPT
jgi:hypothetical protein